MVGQLAVGPLPAAPDITERQALVLAAVRASETMPSVRELCALTGIRWPTIAHRELVRLQVKGLLPAGLAAQRCIAKRTKTPPPVPKSHLRMVGSRTHVDEVAVYRALSGHPARRLGIAERVEAVRIAARRRWPDSLTAERVGITARSVVRIREQHGIAAGVPCTRRAAA